MSLNLSKADGVLGLIHPWDPQQAVRALLISGITSGPVTTEVVALKDPGLLLALLLWSGRLLLRRTEVSMSFQSVELGEYGVRNKLGPNPCVAPILINATLSQYSFNIFFSVQSKSWSNFICT